MVVIPLKITITEDPSFEGSQRALNEVKRAGFAAAGRLWFTQFLPKHFTRAARDIYHYQPRSAKYLRKKRWLASRGKAIYGGNVDNVLSGESERAVRSGAAIRAFPTRLSINMPAPSYFTMRPYRSGQPNKGDETTRVTPDELEQMAAVATAEVEAGLKNLKSKTISTFGET